MITESSIWGKQIKGRVKVVCPYCLTGITVFVSGDAPFSKIVNCDIEEGGCDSTFVAEITKVSAHIRTGTINFSQEGDSAHILTEEDQKLLDRCKDCEVTALLRRSVGGDEEADGLD